MKKLLLTTLNARYSHMSLALRYLRGVLKENANLRTELKEFTINQTSDEILSSIYHGRYDVVCFSTYIWNVELILQIGRNLRKICPDVRILLGGPEVSHAPASLLKDNPWIDGLVMGEGEVTLPTVLEYGFEKPGWQSIAGTAWNTPDGMRINPGAPLIHNLDAIPFPYDDTDIFEDRLVYYESSRGCPYNCSYCLSSSADGVRTFSHSRVFSDLQWLLNKNIKTVKFVDRTFNTNKAHYLPILAFIEANDNGNTCFHFEISAGILSEEELMRFASLRKNLVQLEIGVQSTCSEALKACGRPDWTEKITESVAHLRQQQNIHLHLDLISGLPYESFERFMVSFDAVYRMKPHMLQLGFLKLIKGTALRRNSGFYGYAWREEPPYEVLENKWISYGELTRLKRMEKLLDRYYQNGRFEKTLPLLESCYPTPGALYIALDDWWMRQKLWDKNVGQDEGWLLLYDFALLSGVSKPVLTDAMRWDAITHWKPKAFSGTVIGSLEPPKGQQHDLLHRCNEVGGWLEPFKGIPAKNLLKRFHFEQFSHDPDTGKGAAVIVCFDTEANPTKEVHRWCHHQWINAVEA